jgi:hypothetical protein
MLANLLCATKVQRIKEPTNQECASAKHYTGSYAVEGAVLDQRHS